MLQSWLLAWCGTRKLQSLVSRKPACWCHWQVWLHDLANSWYTSRPRRAAGKQPLFADMVGLLVWLSLCLTRLALFHFSITWRRPTPPRHQDSDAPPVGRLPMPPPPNEQAAVFCTHPRLQAMHAPPAAARTSCVKVKPAIGTEINPTP